jgi:hypothetical protein
MDTVFQIVTESPEWQELLAIEEIQETLDQAKQPISFIPMLLGISVEEFVGSLGHRTVLIMMGMMGPMPVAGLVIDPGDYKDKLEYAVSQAGTAPALAGGAMVEEKEYRDVPHTVVGNKNIKVKYGFLDDYLVAGVGGAFEKLVDHYKDGGKSIKDSANFQFMGQKVSLSSNICFYADLERTAPILEMLGAIGSGEENQMAEMLKQLALSSAKAFAVGLNLSGHTQEIYLHLRAEEPNPITDLLLAPHSPMYSARLVPFDNGVMVGLNIGDPVELVDRGLKLAEMMGVKTAEIEDRIQQLDGMLGINLREDMLPTLTGEFAGVTVLPEEPIDLKANKLQMAMQLSRVKSMSFVGVKDEEKLGETIGKLLKIVDSEPLSLEEGSHKGKDIYTKVVPLNALAPGVALMPSYSLVDNLMVMGSNMEWVQDGIDMLESSPATEIQEKLADSRVLVYLDAGGMANFAIKQGIAEEMGVPEGIQDKARSLGSIAASLALGPDGAGIRLVSMSEDDWATKILRGTLIAIYAKIAEMEEQAAMEESEAEESEQEEPEESEEG